jgi:tetraacyldisaccharide-1-P 4'-kinase
MLDKSKPIFNASMVSNHKFGSHEYYAFAGIGNPNKFFSFLQKLGAKVKYTQIFQDHHKYSVEDIEFLVNDAKNKKLRLITTRKDYVKIQSPIESRNISFIPALQFIGMIKDNEKYETSQIEYLEVELKLEQSEEFFELLMSKYIKYNERNKIHETNNS